MPVLGTRGGASNRGFGFGGISVPSPVVSTSGLASSEFIFEQSNGDLEIRWIDPTFTGSIPLTDVVIRLSDGVSEFENTVAPGVGITNFSGLTVGNNYTVTIQARNDVGASGARTDTGISSVPPQAPIISSCFNGLDKSLIFNWVNPTGLSTGGVPLTRYRVQWEDQVTGAIETQTVNSPPTGTRTVTAAEYNRDYVLRVAVGNDRGFGPYSADSDIVTTTTTLPGVPTIDTALFLDSSAQVNWSAPASNGNARIRNYIIETTPGGTLTTVENVTSTTITGLINGDSYTFKVKARTNFGESAFSSSSNAVIPAREPDAPTIGTATRTTATAATVTYTAQFNQGRTITSFTAVSNPGGITGSVSTSSSGTITISGLDPALTYTFIVFATNEVGNGANSAASNSVEDGLPGAPIIGTATRTTVTAATVSYDPPVDDGPPGSPITSYTATSTPGGLTGTRSGAGAGTITVSGLDPALTYTFRVFATNASADGPLSGESNSVEDGLPGAPINIVAARASGTSATVSYEPPADDGPPGSAITSYTATSTPGGFTGTRSGAGAGTITVSGLTSGTYYTFVVFATNAGGNGPNSASSNSVGIGDLPSTPTIKFSYIRDTEGAVVFSPLTAAQTGGWNLNDIGYEAQLGTSGPTNSTYRISSDNFSYLDAEQRLYINFNNNSGIENTGFNINFASTENGAKIGVTSIDGGNTSDEYFGPNAYSLSMNSGSNWHAVGAIYNAGSNTNSVARSAKPSRSGSTFNGQGSSSSPFSIVIDLGANRTFSQARYYQMFSDGKTTHAALDRSSSGNLETRTSSSWTQIHGFTLLDNDSTSAGVAVNFSSVTTRYLRVRIYNDGRYGNPSYTELFNIKLFGSATSSTYQFRVRATNPSGASAWSSLTTAQASYVHGEIDYIGDNLSSDPVRSSQAALQNWIAPDGVTGVSVVCIGAGGYGGDSAAGTVGGAGGGGLAWYTNYPVTPGNTYYIDVGQGGYLFRPTGGFTGFSNITNTKAVVYANGGSGADTEGGTVGGGDAAGTGSRTGGSGRAGGGGGAAGYSGNGGIGASSPTLYGAAGTGGSGAGGGVENSRGGGVNYYGPGLAGNGGYTYGSGQNGANQGTFGYGGRPGTNGDRGGSGACRIIYPGQLRNFSGSGVRSRSFNSNFLSLPFAPRLDPYPTSPSSTSVVVKWELGTNYGYWPVYEYLIWATRSSTGSVDYMQVTSINADTGTHTITGLTPNERYDISMVARNINGFNTDPASVSVTPGSVGEQIFTSGSYTWTAPAGVTEFSVLVVGGGGGGARDRDAGGGGGASAYSNNLTGAEYEKYSLFAPGGGADTGTSGGTAYFQRYNGGTSYLTRASGGSGASGDGITVANGGAFLNGDGGANGGAGVSGGGGAGGYSGTGGRGATFGGASALSGTGGGGAGGINRQFGGGIGLFGRGPPGGNPNFINTAGVQGQGAGEPGSDPDNVTTYGGGGANWDPGMIGAVRIIWNRTGEITPRFPSNHCGRFVKNAVPSAPQVGFPIASSTTAVNLPYGPPEVIGGDRIRSYTFRATSSGGTIERSLAVTLVTDGTYNFQGLTAGVSYTFSVAAVNNIGTGPFSSYGISVTPNLRGEVVYGPGTFVWQAPVGVTNVSVIAVGGGGGGDRDRNIGGGGGALAYTNNITVTQYRQYNVVVGGGGGSGLGNDESDGGESYFLNTTTVRATGGQRGAAGGAGGVFTNGNNGGNGGRGYNGGGGAGGYGSSGGIGQQTSGTTGTSGLNGSGAGGSNRNVGGGVGIFGRGNNGAYPGGNGSTDQGDTRAFGGGGANWTTNGSSGAVRIVYPGSSRQFPNTDVGPS